VKLRVPSCTLLFALLLVCLGTGAAAAQTPDGSPPSQETVCDHETGAAYGLCNAYCEAMDCESDNPSASATACSKVRTKFQNITGRDLPCEAVACPCNNPAYSTDFVAVVTYQVPVAGCNSGGFNPGVEVTGSFRYLDAGVFAGAGPVCGDSSHPYLHITTEEAQACADLLRAAATHSGVTCPQ